MARINQFFTTLPTVHIAQTCEAVQLNSYQGGSLQPLCPAPYNLVPLKSTGLNPLLRFVIVTAFGSFKWD